MADCEAPGCGQPLPAPNRGPGNPNFVRRYHPGACLKAGLLAGQRRRRGVSQPQEPRRATCRLCADPVAPTRFYYCSADCMDRYERLNSRDRKLVSRYSDTAGPEGTAVSAVELLPDMTEGAAQWRIARARRLGLAS